MAGSILAVSVRPPSGGQRRRSPANVSAREGAWGHETSSPTTRLPGHLLAGSRTSYRVSKPCAVAEDLSSLARHQPLAYATRSDCCRTLRVQFGASTD